MTTAVKALRFPLRAASRRRFAGLLAASLAISIPGAARAQGEAAAAAAAPPDKQRTDLFNRRAAHFASHEGNIAFLALGVLLPLAADGHRGETRTLRTLDALSTSSLLCFGLKEIFREKRPDTDERNSFPSGHATAAFAVATMQSRFHPDQAPAWYLGATLIAYSRVRLNRHYPHDVLAGAVLGAATAEAQLRQRRGLLLAPFLRPTDSDGRRGVTLGWSGSF